MADFIKTTSEAWEGLTDTLPPRAPALGYPDAVWTHQDIGLWKILRLYLCL